MILGIVASSINKIVGNWIDNSLIAYYNMDVNADDTFSTHDGTTNSVTYDTGKMGDAQHTADVTSAGATIPTSTDFSFGNGTTDSPFSVSLYINFDIMNSGYRGWMVARRASTSTNLEYQIAVFDGDLIFVLYNQLGDSIYLWSTYTVNGVLSASTWYHMIFTYDGSGDHTGLNMYIDNGSSVGTTAETGGTYVAMDESTADLTIGHVEYNTSLSVDGLLDGVAFWNKELSASERTEIYTTQSGGSELVSLFPAGNAASIGSNEADATTGWTLYEGTQESSSVSPNNGSYSIKLVANAVTYAASEIILTGLENGANYKIWFYAKVDVYLNQRLTLWSVNGWTTDFNQHIDATSWTAYSLEGTTDSTTATFSFHTAASTADDGAELWVDAVTIIKQ